TAGCRRRGSSSIPWRQQSEQGGAMTRRSTICACVAGLVAFTVIAAAAAFASDSGRRELNGTIWVANRGANTIRGFDAATGDVVATIPMRPGSQPGDLAYAKGRLYVAEEFGSPPAIAIVDAATGEVLGRRSAHRRAALDDDGPECARARRHARREDGVRLRSSRQHPARRRSRAARDRQIALGPLPDTLQLSANEKLLTVGLRGTPAQVAIIDTESFATKIVTIGGPGTIAGHQWTSSNGHFTFAAFEGPGAGVAVIDHTQDDA